MAKMTKSQILAGLAESSGLSKKDVATLMDKIPAKTVVKFRVAKATKEAVM